MFGGLTAIIVFAALFYGAAEYEHMTGWKWAVASLAISFVLLQLFGTMLLVLPAQAGLFGVLWWKNAKRVDTAHEDQAARREQDRRMRQERVRRAHEQADQDKDAKGR